MATRKLADITEIPTPPAELLERAKAAGVELRAHNPERLRAFAEGQITLGELEGISKDAQYQMAKVGFDFLSEGKHEQSRKIFLGLLALDPYDAYFSMALGSIAQREGDLEEADKRYTRALEVNPFSPAALANRGEVRLALGRIDEAIDDLVKALKEDPNGNDAATRRARGLIASVQKELETAQKDPAKTAAEAKKEVEKLGGTVPAVKAKPAAAAKSTKPEPAKATGKPAPASAKSTKPQAAKSAGKPAATASSKGDKPEPKAATAKSSRPIAPPKPTRKPDPKGGKSKGK